MAIVRRNRGTERWPSGLRRSLGKRVYGKPYRGFESHSLRQRLFSGSGCAAKRRDFMIASPKEEVWPDLPYSAWKETCNTLHLWTQIVGKIRLALTPWLNHSWHVPLYVTARGLTTSPIHHEHLSFELTFDFNEHVLDITTSNGDRQLIALRPRTV